MSCFSLKYKDNFIYLDQLENESIHDLQLRLWFVAKNINKYSFDDLVIYSQYYINIKKYKSTYSKHIHLTISEMT